MEDYRFSGPQSFGQWSKGSGASGASANISLAPQSLSGRGSQDGRQASFGPGGSLGGGNRFNVLDAQDNYQMRQNMQSSGGRDNRSGPGSRGGSQRGGGGGRDSMRSGPGMMTQGPPKSGPAFGSQQGRRDDSSRGRDRDSSAASGRSSAGGSRNSSMQGPVSGGRGSTKSPVDRSVSGSEFKGSSKISDDDFKRKSKNIVDEFHNVKDAREAKQSVFELCSDRNVSKFVTNAINSSFETSQEKRLLTARLLGDLVAQKVLNYKAIADG